MNKRLDLAALRDDLELPETRVAAGAWDRGRQRVRRRRTAAAVGAAALVVAVAVVPSLVGGSTGSLEPVGPPPTTLPSPTETVTGSDLTPELTMPPLQADALDGPATESLSDAIGDTDTVPLEGNPMESALLAIGTEDGAVVLGDDLVPRGVSVGQPEIGRYSPLRATSLSPGGRRLLLSLEDRMVLVDLTEATVTTVESDALVFDLPTPSPDISWVDDDHVLVWGNVNGDSLMIDATSGRGQAASFTSSTGFGPEGPVSWQGGTLRVGDRRMMSTILSRMGLSDVPLAGDGYAVAVGFAEAAQAGLPDPPTRPGVAPFVNGVGVVDTETGDALAFLPVSDDVGVARALALIDDDVLVGVDNRRGIPYVVRWDWRDSEIAGVFQLYRPDGTPAVETMDGDVAPTVAWGVGIDAAWGN